VEGLLHNCAPPPRGLSFATAAVRLHAGSQRLPAPGMDVRPPAAARLRSSCQRLTAPDFGALSTAQLRCDFTRGANDSLRLAWMPHPRLQRARARVVNLLRLTWVYGLRHRSGAPSCELPMAHSTIHGSMACGTAAAVRLHARCPRHTALDLGVWPTA